MTTKTILTTIAHIVTCGPCAGTFGRWKAELQDDDADLWNDLTLVNAVPDLKAPSIPKVVKVISCDDDLSTLAYDSYTHHPHSKSHSRGRNHRSSSSHTFSIEEEKSFSPSPNRSRNRHSGDNKKHKNNNNNNNKKDSDLELEQVMEEIGLEYEDEYEYEYETVRSRRCRNGDDGDAELESIMGPRSHMSTTSRSMGTRSQISATSRSMKRRVASSHTAPSPTRRQPSLLQQQQRDQYQCSYATVVTKSSVSLTGSSSQSTLPLTTSHEDSKEEQRESFDGGILCSSWSYEDHNHQQSHDEDEDPHDDGSSYSSVRHKLSFFRKNGKRSSFFRNRSNNSGHSLHGKKGEDGEDWLLASERDGSFTNDTYSTVQTQSCGSTYRSHASHRSSSSGSHANRYKPIF